MSRPRWGKCGRFWMALRTVMQETSPWRLGPLTWRSSAGRPSDLTRCQYRATLVSCLCWTGRMVRERCMLVPTLWVNQRPTGLWRTGRALQFLMTEPEATGEGASGEASGECDRFGPGDTGVHEREIDLQTVVVRTSSGFNATETSFKRGTKRGFLKRGKLTSSGLERKDSNLTSSGLERKDSKLEASIRGT